VRSIAWTPVCAAAAADTGLARQAAAPRPVAITHAQLFDVRSGSIQPDVTIVGAGDRLCGNGCENEAERDFLSARRRTLERS
jgi:hypothetical protein